MAAKASSLAHTTNTTTIFQIFFALVSASPEVFKVFKAMFGGYKPDCLPDTRDINEARSGQGRARGHEHEAEANSHEAKGNCQEAKTNANSHEAKGNCQEAEAEAKIALIFSAKFYVLTQFS